MNSLQKGSYGEKIFETKCIEKGWDCYSPVANQTRADYIIDRGKGFERVQVKSTTAQSGKIVAFIFKTQTNSKDKKVYFYSKEEVDIFAIVDIESKDVYVVDNKADGNKAITLRVDKPKNNQTKGIHLAENFKI